MSFPDSASAHELLDGLLGIEIGGSAHNAFNIPGCLNVDFTDDLTTVFKASERDSGHMPLAVDIVASGDKLPFADESLEYVLHSHVFEHLWDPIGSINEWLRVLKPGGIIFMIVPHKERTFDADRPRTRLVELILRHDGTVVAEPGVDAHGTHFSVWITEDVVELVDYLGFEILLVQDVDDKIGNGFTVVFRKPGPPPVKRSTIDLGCGGAKISGARTLGIDKLCEPGVDIVLDLAVSALPFEDDSIPRVYSNGLFQFLHDPVPLLREIVRVSVRGATVEIWTPDAGNTGASQLGSCNRFSENTWVELLASNMFDECGGHLTLKEIRMLISPQTVETLKSRNIPVDFAVAHLKNVVTRVGAIMTVHKPRKQVGAENYMRRLLLEPIVSECK